MVLTRSTPEGGTLGGANAQGEHFVSTDPRAILPSLCFNRVSLSEEMVSSGGKALDCGLGATLDLSSANLLLAWIGGARHPFLPPLHFGHLDSAGFVIEALTPCDERG